jgi:hypothetical protein
VPDPQHPDRLPGLAACIGDFDLLILEIAATVPVTISRNAATCGFRTRAAISLPAVE